MMVELHAEQVRVRWWDRLRQLVRRQAEQLHRILPIGQAIRPILVPSSVTGRAVACVTVHPDHDGLVGVIAQRGTQREARLEDAMTPHPKGAASASNSARPMYCV